MSSPGFSKFPAPARNSTVWLTAIAFFVTVLVAFLLFFFPAFIIRPFRYQSPQALSWAMSIRQIAPVWTVLAAILALMLALVLWSESSKGKKLLLILGFMLAAGSATMARLNYFEWMFHHLRTPGFEPAKVSKLDPSQMVLAVRFGDDARAYPILEMAYHHVVNDVVGGVPIAVTY
jgi:Protein of unknown function (DUF3179)